MFARKCKFKYTSDLRNYRHLKTQPKKSHSLTRKKNTRTTQTSVNLKPISVVAIVRFMLIIELKDIGFLFSHYFMVLHIYVVHR